MAGFDGKARNIGESAAIGQLRNLANTIVDVKRFIGRKFTEQDVQREIQYSPNKIVQTEDGGVGFEVSYDDSTVVVVFTPEQVVGMLLGQLQRTVEKETELKGGDCVISVPGYFTDRQRRAVHAAAAVGGVNCIRLISENAAGTRTRRRAVASPRRRASALTNKRKSQPPWRMDSTRMVCPRPIPFMSCSMILATRR